MKHTHKRPHQLAWMGLLAAPDDRIATLRVWRLGTLGGQAAVPAAIHSRIDH